MIRLLLLHGLGADRRAFQRFERLLPDTWDIFAADLLGHGDAPKPATGYRLEDHAAYIASVIDEHWGSDAHDEAAPIIAGHSYGAAVAVATAALYPTQVRAIALLDAIVGDTRVGTQTGQVMQARHDGTLADVIPVLFADQSPALQRWFLATWQTMSLGVIDEFDHDWTRFAAHVTCPVAVIHGDLDQGGGGDLPADWFDQPYVTRIAGAGHYLHASHARETAAALVEAATSVEAATH